MHPDLAIHAPINIPPCLVNLRPFKHITFTLCGVGFKQNILVMDYLGNIRLCSFSPTIIGNVRDMSIDAMFHSDRAAQFIQAHPRFCDSCKIVKKCQGGCKASADNCFGDAARENPFLARYKTEPLRGFWRVNKHRGKRCFFWYCTLSEYRANYLADFKNLAQQIEDI